MFFFGQMLLFLFMATIRSQKRIAIIQYYI